MTIGIYSLHFKGTTHIYIGQSVNIESRYKEHLTNLRTDRASDKLSAAYLLFGIPELFIVEECSIEELDTKELYYINEFNCVEQGLNSFKGTPPRNTNKYSISKKSKYSEDVYYQIMLECIKNPLYSPQKIAALTNTDSVTVSNLRNFKSFTWLEQRYPEDYQKLKEIRNIPNKSYTPSAIKKVEYYPAIVSPEGEVFVLERGQVRSFAKDKNINYTGLNKVLNNKLEHISGWRLSIG